MSTDPWGVESTYEDTSHRWHTIHPETYVAILAAMGVSAPDEPRPPIDQVHVVWSGETARCPYPGVLHLEDGTAVRVGAQFPPDLPWGYHRLLDERGENARLVIVAPGQCLVPDLQWGWAVQLYAARSSRSWGLGDLGDLAALGAWARRLGAWFLLVNPLGAGSPVVPQEPSPYFPNSRRFLDPRYVRIEEVPGARELGPELEPLRARAAELNRHERIDRDAVLPLKRQALKLLWSRFGGCEAFDRFCQQRGAELDEFATWCALAEAHASGDWRTWPAEFRHPASPAVDRFAQARVGEVAYHKWVQWVLDEQVAHAAWTIPLVNDLPIGVDPGGADAWAWQDLLAEGCSIGAPPDVFNPAGQDWTLPPFVPHRLRAAEYRPFVQTLRAALRHAAGLRIDHVMGLFRLYWIPHGFGPHRGAYVRYRPEEMLAIVALESRRAGAFVVGEDLGTVEPWVRTVLADRGILSFRVFWFEKTPPAHYPPLAMAALTTHDLPTVVGLWSGEDAREQEALGVGDAAATSELADGLARALALPPDASPAEVVEAAYRALGQAPCRVLLATLEDALCVARRPNMPGTTARQRPNWCLGLPGGIEALEAADLPRRIAQALSPGRQRPQ